MPKLLDTLTSQRLFIRDQYVMLDRDIAQHLGLKTFRFNERCNATIYWAIIAIPSN